MLEHPDAQPYLPRLSGAGSMRDELEALLTRGPLDATAADYRRLILVENATGKRSASARTWVWKRLKLKYALDRPTSPEFVAFRRTMAATTDGTERGLVTGLMFSRTDRLFRDLTLSVVLTGADHRKPLERSDVEAAVETIRGSNGFAWSDESVRSIVNHFMSAVKDFGYVDTTTGRHVRIDPGPEATAFAATLGKLQGLSDRQVLDSRWFQLLGCDTVRAADALAAAARRGRLRFRMQADVVELDLHDNDTEERRS